MAEENKSIASLAKTDLTVEQNAQPTIQGVGVSLSPSTPVTGDKLARAIMDTAQQAVKTAVATDAISKEMENDLFDDKVNQMKADMVANKYEQMSSSDQKVFLDNLVQKHHEDLERSEDYDKKLGVFYVNELSGINKKETTEIKATKDEYVQSKIQAKVSNFNNPDIIDDVINTANNSETAFGDKKEIANKIFDGMIDQRGQDLQNIMVRNPKDLMGMSNQDIIDHFGELNKLNNVSHKNKRDDYINSAILKRDALLQSQASGDTVDVNPNDIAKQYTDPFGTGAGTDMQNEDTYKKTLNQLENKHANSNAKGKYKTELAIKEVKQLKGNHDYVDIIIDTALNTDNYNKIADLSQTDGVRDDVSGDKVKVPTSFTRTKIENTIFNLSEKLRGVTLDTPEKQEVYKDTLVKMAKLEQATGVKSPLLVELNKEYSTGIKTFSTVDDIKAVSIAGNILNDINYKEYGFISNKLLLGELSRYVANNDLKPDQKVALANKTIKQFDAIRVGRLGKSIDLIPSAIETYDKDQGFDSRTHNSVGRYAVLKALDYGDEINTKDDVIKAIKENTFVYTPKGTSFVGGAVGKFFVDGFENPVIPRLGRDETMTNAVDYVIGKHGISAYDLEFVERDGSVVIRHKESKRFVDELNTTTIYSYSQKYLQNKKK